MTHKEFFDNSALYNRLTKTCLAYQVGYDEVASAHVVTIFSVQRGRSNAELGTIVLKSDEWKLFHETAYLNWEQLDDNEEPSRQ